MTQPLDAPYAHDPKGMGTLIEGIPDQIEQALQRITATPWKLNYARLPSTLAVGAMGGSAIAADPPLPATKTLPSKIKRVASHPIRDV